MSVSAIRHGARSENRALILRTLLRHGALARIALARLTGLTPAAISHITRELIDAGLLCEVGRYRGEGRGADAILLDLPEQAPLIGVAHQGVSALRIGLCNLRGSCSPKRSLRPPSATHRRGRRRPSPRPSRDNCATVDTRPTRWWP